MNAPLKRTFVAAVAMLAGATAAQATAISLDQYYGLQTVLTNDSGQIIDSAENGKTSTSASYSNSPTEISGSIQLADGSMHALASTEGGAEVAFANTLFGDTVTFAGGAGTTASFGFAVDGTIRADAFTNVLNSYQSYSVTARLALFDAATNVTLTNWFGQSFGSATHTALDTDSFNFSATNNATDIMETVNQALNVSTALSSDTQAFKVFAQLDLVAIRNDNPGTTTLDFLNTGTLSILAGPGVSYTSASGVLLTGKMSPVPVPASALLLLGGLAGLAGLRRRKAF